MEYKKKLTNKHIIQKTDQSNASINKWDLRLFWKFPIYDQISNVLSYYEFYKNASIETNYYIKDLGNNAVCERAEA